VKIGSGRDGMTRGLEEEKAGRGGVRSGNLGGAEESPRKDHKRIQGGGEKGRKGGSHRTGGLVHKVQRESTRDKKFAMNRGGATEDSHVWGWDPDEAFDIKNSDYVGRRKRKRKRGRDYAKIRVWGLCPIKVR